MTRHIPHLRSIPSIGEREPRTYIEPDTGALVDAEQPRTPCGGCQEITAEGELIVNYRRSWWHDKCAKRDIDSGNVREAWLALGHDLARSPRAYGVKESRAIVGALLGMIHTSDEFSESDFEPAIGGAS